MTWRRLGDHGGKCKGFPSHALMTSMGPGPNALHRRGRETLNRKRGYPVGLFLAILLMLFDNLFSGCGYHFRADGEPVGIELGSLAIPLIESTSSTLGFESDFTRILREEFISHGRVPLVAEGGAQAVLSGKIYRIREDALSYDSEDLVVKGRTATYTVTDSRHLRVWLDMKLTEKSSGKVIWHERGLREKASYKIGTDPLRNRYNKQLALEKIARRLAKTIYLKTMERF